MIEMKPTYEEVVAYANSAGLIGKVDTAYFYDYYDKQGFTYRGAIMDWQNKLHEWAGRQKGAVKQSAKEYNVLKKIDGEKIMLGGKFVRPKGYLEWLKKEVDSWERKAEANG